MNQSDQTCYFIDVLILLTSISETNKTNIRRGNKPQTSAITYRLYNTFSLIEAKVHRV